MFVHAKTALVLLGFLASLYATWWALPLIPPEACQLGPFNEHGPAIAHGRWLSLDYTCVERLK